ncbi:MAG TPA: hypothetical protein VFQ12_08315 [Thermoleophilaceae bacterium]|nr:hypothetical protein [Thermoleophilaceae bacterium]
MILDEQLPGWDVRERHSVRIRTSPEQALAAARAVTTREVPLLVGLMAVRSLPASLARRQLRRLDRPVLQGFARIGFAALGHSDRELAHGGVGRFWQPSGGLLSVPAEEFATFDEPGYVKAGFDFRVEPDGDGCILSTETRVLATDDGARRKFRLYWLLIRPGSGLIRRDWLRAIRARAERAADT